MTFAVQWKGIEQVRANLRSLAERYPEEMGRVLREEGVAIMDESMRICPVDQENMHEDGTPHLVDTGQVSGPYNDGQGPYVILSYDTPYAVIQHEVQEYHHNFPEQWKYLEHPLNARVPFLAANLARGVDLERMMQGYSSPSQDALLSKLKSGQQQGPRSQEELLNLLRTPVGNSGGGLRGEALIEMLASPKVDAAISRAKMKASRLKK